MFRPNCWAILRLVFEQVECTMDNALNLRELHLFKDQPEDGRNM